MEQQENNPVNKAFAEAQKAILKSAPKPPDMSEAEYLRQITEKMKECEDAADRILPLLNLHR